MSTPGSSTDDFTGPGPVTSSVDEPGVLTLAYEAGDIYPTRSGSVKLTLRTPRADDIHARLQAWTETSTR